MKTRVLDPCLLLIFRRVWLILARAAYKLRKLDPALALHILVDHQAVYTHRVKISIKVKHLVRVDFRDLYRDLLLDEALALTSDIFFLKIEQNFVIECLFVAYHIRHFCAQRHDNIDLLCVS